MVEKAVVNVEQPKSTAGGVGYSGTAATACATATTIPLIQTVTSICVTLLQIFTKTSESNSSLF